PEGPGVAALIPLLLSPRTALHGLIRACTHKRGQMTNDWPIGRFGSEADMDRQATPAKSVESVESPGGISPPGAPRSVHEPLDSHGSRCSAASMAELPMSEERRICAAKPIKPVACSFGFKTQPFEFAARPADDIEVNPLQGRTQLRSVEVAVVVDP